MLAMIVRRKDLAISISMERRGAMIFCTSALAAATSGATLRGSSSGNEPVSSSIWVTICSYTFSGLISRLRSLCSIRLLIRSARTDLR